MFFKIMFTPYNRLFLRQIIVLKTDPANFVRERVGENFLFAIIKNQILGFIFKNNVFLMPLYMQHRLKIVHASFSCTDKEATLPQY